MTKFLVKIISLDSFDITVANNAILVAMFGYTKISAISMNGGRCDVLDVFFCDANIFSFIGVYDICILSLKDLIGLSFYVIVGPTVVIRLVVRIIIFPSVFQFNR